MIQEFYSNGKLLISGEYAVLDGALAWGMPTTYGQFLKVTPNNSSQIHWKSLDEKNAIWFEATYNCKNLKTVSFSDQETSEALLNILLKVQELNSEFLDDFTGFDIETKLTFPKNWGLGSSSTLINNIANWGKVNAQELLARTFGGSGYDISCAQHDTPILFEINKDLPQIKPVNSKPAFADSLYFIYLNQKKNSRDAIKSYQSRNLDKLALILTITELTKKMVACTEIKDFEILIQQHEKVLSEALAIPTVKSELFSDYFGAIKSLGGWGGDFILATGDKNTPAYFKTKGYPTVIPFTEMIL